MRLRRISKQTEKEYKTRLWLKRAFDLLLLICPILIIYYSNHTVNHIKLFVSVSLLLILITFNGSSKYGRKLRKFKYGTLNIVKKYPYVIINEDGITLDSDENETYTEKIYTWNELVKIEGKHYDISLSNKNPKKYSFASICSEKERKIPEILKRPYSNPWKLRKAIKKANEENDSELTDFFASPPDRIFLELYDEMLNEIRKYWKKNDESYENSIISS